MIDNSELLARLDANSHFDIVRDAAAEIRRLQGQLEAERKAHALADRVIVEFQDRFLKERKAREEAELAREELMRLMQETTDNWQAAERQREQNEEQK